MTLRAIALRIDELIAEVLNIPFDQLQEKDTFSTALTTPYLDMEAEVVWYATPRLTNTTIDGIPIFQVGAIRVLDRRFSIGIGYTSYVDRLRTALPGRSID